MNKFIEENRRLLIFYWVAARIIGWVLVILSAMMATLALCVAYQAYRFPGSDLEVIPMLGEMLEILFCQLPLGIIVLGVAQFVRYVSESDYQPGWLLRHGTSILYLFAVLMFVGPLIRYCSLSPATKLMDTPYDILHLLIDATKALILIGMGNILKRAMPVIEESKTLV